MSPPNNGGRNAGRGKSKDSKDNSLIERLRGGCPAHRRNDLDALVKQLDGDEETIQARISEWWEEPAAREGDWEDVNKNKKTKKDVKVVGGRGGRGEGGRGGGRGRSGRGGRDGRGRGRGERGAGREGRGGRGDNGLDGKVEGGEQNGQSHQPGVPPVASARAPQGAWAKKSGEPPAIELSPSDDNLPPAEPDDNPPINIITTTVSVPAPAPVAPPAPVAKPVRPVAPPAGNVWATKGAAHIIRAEKEPKPIPQAPIAPIQRSVPKPLQPEQEIAEIIMTQQEQLLEEPEPQSLEPAQPAQPIIPEAEPEFPEPEPIIENVPPSLNPAPTAVTSAPTHNAWGQEATPKPEPVAPAPPASTQIPVKPDIPPSPVGTKPISPPTPIVPVAVEKPVSPVMKPQAPPGPPPKPPQEPSRPPPTNVLNMGHWETGDADDSSNLDFGFGSFGVDNETGSMDVTAANTANSVSKSAPQVSQPPAPPKETPQTAPVAGPSPARPPPGLPSIGGMRPIPTEGVYVHELENKLEEASLNKTTVPVQEKPMTSSLPTQQPQIVPEPPGVAAHALPTQPSYGNHYGMGMYSYNPAASGSGFVGIPGATAPVLGAGVVPGQPKPPSQQGGPPNLAGQQPVPPPSSLYGAPQQNPTSVASIASGNNPSDTSPAGGMPPGIPNMPYGNPALFYQQQPFHMGQQHGGIGYSYGYNAQYGGVAQGGFGYPQAMGQSGGYGHAPAYHDDQGAAHHTGGSGGYQNKSGGGGGGGYRGRNAHHNNNQYQNQYNPQQHGGYGGQPYGMGYHGDHFNQRGAYGQHAGMGDPYGMQPQQTGVGYGGGGFQDDDQYNKGKKGGRSLQQFQPQGPPPNLGGGGGQQPFGLQGHQSTDSNQQTGGAGGGSWSNQGGGGWSSGAPSWQGK